MSAQLPPLKTLREMELEARIAELEAKLERIDSFDGHLDWLREHYPETTFDGSSGDIGAVNVVLARKLLQAEAEMAALKAELAKYRSVVPESLRRWAERGTG
jgi:hypothetical protein